MRTVLLGRVSADPGADARKSIIVCKTIFNKAKYHVVMDKERVFNNTPKMDSGSYRCLGQ